MKHYIILIFSLFISGLVFSQGFGEYLAKNAIEVKQDFSLDSIHYNAIKGFALIMVGEMHGTKEPSWLVEELSKLILKHEGSISIGFEIPSEEMKVFIDSPSDSTLKATHFFSKENHDGRNGQAWFDLIKYFNSNPNVNLFFFDNYNSMKITNRDSAMYTVVKYQKKLFPNSKIITLSGNIHNSLIPFNEIQTMGTYLLNDSITFDPKSICSINHAFSEGTMMNDVGNGLEMTTIDFEENVYSKSTSFENYLVFYNTINPSSNNCIFYTRRVNYSGKLGSE